MKKGLSTTPFTKEPQGNCLNVSTPLPRPPFLPVSENIWDNVVHDIRPASIPTNEIECQCHKKTGKHTILVRQNALQMPNQI